MTWWGSYYTKDMLSRLSSSEPGGFKESPGGMLHPLHFMKILVSQKPFRFPHLNHIYSSSLCWDSSSDTDRGSPWGYDAPPSLHLRPYISETIQIPTPKPYIFLFHMLRCIQWHQPGSPWGHATIPSLYKRLGDFVLLCNTTASCFYSFFRFIAFSDLSNGWK